MGSFCFRSASFLCEAALSNQQSFPQTNLIHVTNTGEFPVSLRLKTNSHHAWTINQLWKTLSRTKSKDLELRL